MKQNLLHIALALASFFITETVWGENLPAPNRANDYQLDGGKTYILPEGGITLKNAYRYKIVDGEEITIDLNGQTFNANNKKIALFSLEGGHLIIKDSKGGGKIKGTRKTCFFIQPNSGKTAKVTLEGGTIEDCEPSDGEGGAVEINARGTFEMKGGTITGCHATEGAGVYVNGGTFKMSGGTISNNFVFGLREWNPPQSNQDLPETTTNQSAVGGGVYLESGSFEMTGGLISGNAAYSGGGVFVTTNSTFTFKGGKIEGNYAVSKLGAGSGNGGGIYIQDKSNCTINGGTLSNNRATRYGGGININGSTMTIPNCTISGNLASSGGGISMETSGSTLNLEGCTLNGNISKVSGSDPNGANGGGGGIFLVNGTLNMSSTNNIQNNVSRVLGGGILANAGTIKVTNGTTTFRGNQATTSDGGAIYLKSGSVIVNSGAIMNIGGTEPSHGNTALNSGGGIYCKGTITVNGTSTMGYNTAKDGGAIYVTGGNVTLSDNTIYSNTASHYGGALYVGNGNLVMNGTSKIYNNSATMRGGAAYVYNGNISTGESTEILNNTVKGDDTNDKASGGAFYIEGKDSSKKGTLNLKGETSIKENYTKDNGGAITLLYGDVMITGSQTTISSNKAKNGGAVYINTGNFISSADTQISNNSATGSGGAVYIKDGSITFNNNQKGLALSGNHATNGGAFFVNNGSIDATNLLKATITNNYSTEEGGAFYVNNGNIHMCVTEISGNGKSNGNPVTTNGGAIALYNGTFEFADGSEIKNNGAMNNGGALYISNETSTNITCLGGSYIGNQAGLGGGIYASGPINLTFAANVRDNVAQNGGGLYLDGATITIGYNENNKQINALIVGNKAEVSTNTASEGVGPFGVGGGIYLVNKGTLSFSNLDKLGIYNNSANYEAADIYTDNGSTIHLPNVENMNLEGFEVPANSLYWVKDVHDNRYEEALRNVDSNIQNMILSVEGESDEITDGVCLDLGYDLIFVTLTAEGLNLNDQAAVTITYMKNGTTPTVYQKVLLTGSNPSVVVALPSNKWKFEVTPWSQSMYDSAVSALINNVNTDITNDYQEIKRLDIEPEDVIDLITVSFTAKDNNQNLKYIKQHTCIKVNEMKTN